MLLPRLRCSIYPFLPSLSAPAAAAAAAAAAPAAAAPAAAAPAAAARHTGMAQPKAIIAKGATKLTGALEKLSSPVTTEASTAGHPITKLCMQLLSYLFITKELVVTYVM